ncbi:RimK/LysX family protein [Thiotrichales bacterium 19S3-7]|nr:RimK/LysX family protein [Thiotrichales bacterium 19S3-7]MCF6802156.1 RimK/LysX family protein [Thiotrichales bacterium 19S3-11]
MKRLKIINQQLLIGRNEWFSLPRLNIPLIKGKIDTGAKTSSLHAFDIKAGKRNGKAIVYFKMHPLQGDTSISICCAADIVDERLIMSSNGHKEKRFVIETELGMNELIWKVQVTLSNRDPLKYRMLIGREALKNKVLIDPSLSCNQKKYSKLQSLSYYKNL